MSCGQLVRFLHRNAVHRLAALFFSVHCWLPGQVVSSVFPTLGNGKVVAMDSACSLNGVPLHCDVKDFILAGVK